MAPYFDEVIANRIEVPGPTRPEPAAQFGSHVGVEGNLDITGELNMLNADCAEEFEVDTDCRHLVAPGTVVVLGAEGHLRYSTAAYDKCVAGIVSGGGEYESAIVLDRKSSEPGRMAVALMGKVSCKVDASYGPVEVGDLLTTSDTPGHAMKVGDAARAFGAVIGKALRPLRDGKALIPVLVALQ